MVMPACAACVSERDQRAACDEIRRRARHLAVADVGPARISSQAAR